MHPPKMHQRSCAQGFGWWCVNFAISGREHHAGETCTGSLRGLAFRAARAPLLGSLSRGLMLAEWPKLLTASSLVNPTVEGTCAVRR